MIIIIIRTSEERINIHYYFKNNNLIKLNSLKSNFVNNKLIILKLLDQPILINMFTHSKISLM